MASAEDYDRDFTEELSRGVELLKQLGSEEENTEVHTEGDTISSRDLQHTDFQHTDLQHTDLQRTDLLQSQIPAMSHLDPTSVKYTSVPNTGAHGEQNVEPVTSLRGVPCSQGTSSQTNPSIHGNQGPSQSAIKSPKEEKRSANQKPFSQTVVDIFFTNLNANNPLLWKQNNFGPHYFTEDASFLRICIVPHSIIKCFLGREMVTQKYLQLVCEENLQFYPNISEDGILTHNSQRTDGLLQVMVCGVFLKDGHIHGTFEQMLVLSKQSFDPNDYRIKASTLKLQVLPNANMPKLSDKSSVEIKELATLWLKCEACKKIYNADQVPIIPCCVNHPVCLHCLDRQSQRILDDENTDSQITCPVEDCSSYIPESRAQSLLHPTVYRLLQKKMEQRTLEAIKKMNDVHSCPVCGVSVVVHPKLKKFTCMNSSCRAISCRFCKQPWGSCDHTQCSKNVIAEEVEGSGEMTLPKSWISMTEYPGKPYITVLLDPSGTEYGDIVDLYGQTLGRSRIRSIRRIQNRKLWQKYCLTRQHMIEEIGKSQINEQRLFHGTSWESIKFICTEGLDWRNSGKNATAFGQGTYFARDASYSDTYSNVYQNAATGPPSPFAFSAGFSNPILSNPLFSSVSMPKFGQNFGVTASENYPSTAVTQVKVTDDVTQIFSTGYKYMFVVRVLVGRYTKGNSKFRKPPTDSNGCTYHSCVNKEINPSIFVIFESSQCYCEYLIEYK